MWEPSCISGKVALPQRGLDYAFNQLSFGTDLFREIIDATTSEMLLEDLTLALTAEDDDDDDGGGDYDDDSHNTEDETSNNDKLIHDADIISIEDILLDMESILKTSNSYAELDAVDPEVYDNQCMVWKLLGRNLCPIFVQFRCPRSPTTFSPYDSMDFYVLSSNFNVVTSKNLQFFCNLRSKIDLFSAGNFMLFTIIVLVQVS